MCETVVESSFDSFQRTTKAAYISKSQMQINVWKGPKVKRNHNLGREKKIVRLIAY